MWTINTEAVETAAETLGLSYPVRVRVVPDGPAGMAGKYHGLWPLGPTTDVPLDRAAHHVSLSGNLGADMASRCLWHEMTHAAQCERFLPIEKSDEEPYVIANRGLHQAFRKEMQGVRRDYNTTTANGMAHYGNISFEKEASYVMDKATLKLVIGTKAGVTPDGLTDEHGRSLFRVDSFKDGAYDQKKKRRAPDQWINTMYVWAKETYDAKKFAREDLKLPWNNTTIRAYRVRPAKEEVKTNGK